MLVQFTLVGLETSVIFCALEQKNDLFLDFCQKLPAYYLG